MRQFISLVLYTALAFGANTAMATDLAPLKTGEMRKLVLADDLVGASEAVFVDAKGTERRLADWHGKVVLLNLWATWCAPCREEMPALDRLEAALGGDDFAVVTLATGRNPLPAIEKFFTEAGVTRLPILRDERQTLSREMGAMGLPVTILLDREGREVARLIGGAEWDSPEAKAVISALIKG
ncbi:TlpA disulfide reductase family protein [Phaeovulum sp.]|uniref:TlpA disulfide reductase family protein n=1 Tax=Phaeovulum sp. TaxID=2934796 RepID=UPI0039E72658